MRTFRAAADLLKEHRSVVFAKADAEQHSALVRQMQLQDQPLGAGMLYALRGIFESPLAALPSFSANAEDLARAAAVLADRTEAAAKAEKMPSASRAEGVTSADTGEQSSNSSSAGSDIASGPSDSRGGGGNSVGAGDGSISLQEEERARCSWSLGPSMALRHPLPSCLTGISSDDQSVAFPLQLVTSVAAIAEVGNQAGTMLLLLSSPWCIECADIETSMRSAAAQLTLLHRSVRLGLADVGTAEGALVSSALYQQQPVRLLPCLLVLSGSGVWQYHGPTDTGSLVGQMSRWATGRQAAPMSGDLFRGPVGGVSGGPYGAGRPAGPYAMPYGMPPMPAWTHSRGGSNDDKSGYQLVGRLVPAHLLGGDPLIEPKGSHVLPLTAANLSHALGDGSPARPYHPRALLLLYGSESSTDWAGGARTLHQTFRQASSILHARGMRDSMYKAFVGSGVSGELGTHRRKGSERRGGSAAGRDDRPSGMPPQPRVRGDPSVSGLDSPEWKFALRSVLAPEQQPQRILTACQQMLPRILLLSHGRAQLWGAGVQHANDFVDVFSHLGRSVSVSDDSAPFAFLSVPSSAALGPQRSPPDSALTTPEAVLHLNAHDFHATAKRYPTLLAVFTTRWCVRCVELTAQLQRAARLLARKKPAAAVAIAVIDMSDPTNLHWLVDELRIVSFPVGLIYRHGTTIGTYLGGPTAHAIAQELFERSANSL